MKSFIKFALLASIACSFNPADEVQAQRKFSFGRGNSNSGSGSNRNSGRSQSSGSGQSSFRSRFSGGNSGSSNNGSQNRSTQSSNTSTIKRDLNSFRKFSPRSSVTPDKSRVGTTQQKNTTNNTDNGRSKLWRDVIRNSQTQDDSNLKKQIVSRFLNNGSSKSNSNSQTSGGGQSGQHADSHQDRKERLGKFFNKVVTQNLHKNHWCHTRSSKCHWWVNYCKPISHCHADEIVVCNWSRVHCSPAVHVGIHQPAVQWYLGMKGILLPGKGIGIDTVEPGSPAEAVGLQPGMVLTVCNGIALVDEGAMQEAIRISGGVLQMTLLSADGSQVLEGSVRMTQIAAVSF